MLMKDRKIVPLEEGFKEMGLDPDKMIGEMERNTALVEQRTRPSVDSAGPPLPSYGDPASIADKALLSEDTDTHDTHVDTDDALDEGDLAAFDKAIEALEASGHIEEAKRIRKARGSAARRKKRERRIQYRQHKGQLKKAAKRYRRSAAGKRVAKRHKRVLKRMGGPKKGFIIRTADVDQAQTVEQLRADLNASGADFAEEVAGGPFEEAAESAALVCAMLADILESTGDGQSAETLRQISESGVSLADDLYGCMTEDDVRSEYMGAFEELIGSTIKALKVWEAEGMPSLDEAVEYGLASTHLTD